MSLLSLSSAPEREEEMTDGLDGRMIGSCRFVYLPSWDECVGFECICSR